ncbi:MAG: hypothetical protein V4447_14145 [Pseudomonadota bacterium]
MKKTILLFLALSALPLSSTAQSTPEINTVTITQSTQLITMPSKLYRMTPEEFYYFKGTYELSNGQALTLFDRGRRMYAKMSNQENQEIVATANNTFVALDRRLKVRIDLHENGQVSGEINFVAPSVAQSKPDISGEQLIQIVSR